MNHSPGRRTTSSESGFTLVELLPSLAILSFIMATMLGFLAHAQKSFQGNQVVSASNQEARAAMEMLTQDVGQAGYNPNFVSSRTGAVAVSASASPQCVTLSDISRINPGDWISVDAGINNETVQVTGTTNNATCAAANQVQGIFTSNHTSPGSTLPFPVNSYKLPYPSGILTESGTFTDHNLELFGDVNDDGIINYLVYNLAPTTTPATTVSLNGQLFTLYSLMRSITPVTFASGAVRNAASPLVQNILYNNITSVTNPLGPTGQPLFSYIQTYQVGIIPNQIVVVGTVNINVCVAVNPGRFESGQLEWFTMATRIRPLNLASAVQVSQAGGFRFLPPLPAGLPML